MNILILSSSNPYKNAGIVARDFLYELRQIKDINVKLGIKEWGKYHDNDIFSIDNIALWFTYKIIRFLKRMIDKNNYNYLVQEYNQTKTRYSTRKILKKSRISPDVIIILFSVKFLNAKNLYELYSLTNAPIILYFMDMAMLTGICHYSFNCKNYVKNCGLCPAINSNKTNDQSRVNFIFKEKYFKKTKIYPIVGSEWQLLQVKKSPLFQDLKISKILLPIDSKIFKPVNKTQVRKILNLPPNKKILFFGAVSFNNRRKGGKELTDSLCILAQSLKNKQDIHLIIAGKNISKNFPIIPFSYTDLGYLSPDKLHLAFQAADVFLSPSIDDSGPMMVNQSILCGTPVVAFNIGVALDLVITGETGYRATLGNTEDFANGIKYLICLSQIEYNKICVNSRKKGLELCNSKNHIDKILEIYNYEN